MWRVPLIQTLVCLLTAMAVVAPGYALDVIDNGGAGYAEYGGSWWHGSGGYLNDQAGQIDQYDAYATFQFNGLTPGSYAVCTTYVNAGNRNDVVPYTVYDGTEAGTALGTVYVDQKYSAPSGYTYDSTNWDELGTFTITGNTLTVVIDVVYGQGFSMADAVLIEEANAPPSVDAGSDDTITLPTDTVNLDGTVSDDGLPDPPASVTTEWTKQSGPGTVTFGNAYAVDTTATFSADGVYVLRLTADDGDETAYDEVTITVEAETTFVIDNGDAGYTEYGGGFWWHGTGGYLNDQAGNADGIDAYAEFEFTDLTPGAYYVRTTYVNSGNRNQYVPYIVYDGTTAGTELGTVYVDQKYSTPSGYSYDGANWDELGVFTITGTTLTVVIDVVPGQGFSMADGVLLERTNAAPVVDAGSDAMIALPTNTVSLDGTVSDDGLPNPPGSVASEWTKESGPGTVTFGDEYAVDTTATFGSAGVYVLRLTADDDDETAYDEVTITVEPPTQVALTVIDNGDAAYTEYGGPWTQSTTQGFQDDMAYAANQVGSYVTFQFDGLLPGPYYVRAMYVASGNRNAAVPYTIYDGTMGGTSLGTAYVNQQTVPIDYEYFGWYWDEVTTATDDYFTITGNTLTVKVEVVDGQGFTMADAVMIEPVPQMPTLSLDEPEAFDFSQLTLVDEVICGDPNEPHTLLESSQGISDVEVILSDDCRALPDDTDEPSYFGYVLGANCGLTAGNAYILVVEYPEDAPRSMVVINQGCETNRGFHTGTTLGDCLNPDNVTSNSESIHYGLSGEYRTWQQLFHLHDRFVGIEKPYGAGARPYLPADGFHVLICQYGAHQDPTSSGAAVRRIALYEAPAIGAYTLSLPELPEGLPKRHLFWREEMADNVIGSTVLTERGVAEEVDWFEYKARLCKFLGMNTFCKDLLEFGANQGWDCSEYGDGMDSWFYHTVHATRWEEILQMLVAGDYDLDVLPYYEYAGGNGDGDEALGRKKRCIPLALEDGYTQIKWCEEINIDVSDPDAITDATRMLEQTITVLHEGNRPIYNEGTERAGSTSTGTWGYIDFGTGWQDVRICQTWTRSLIWHGGDASPFAAVYWHDDPNDFAGGTPPPEAIVETTLNFITKRQVGALNRWTKDVDVTGSPITPQGRYLLLKSPDPVSTPLECLIVGCIDGQGTDLATIAVTAGGVNGYAMQFLFDNQPGFNTDGVNVLGAWLRPRISAIPMGFAEDSTLTRFSSDLQIIPSVTRADLQADQNLLEDYYDWWFNQRKMYLNELRDYLQTNVDDDCFILYTWDPSETGVEHPNDQPDVVADDATEWAAYVAVPMRYDDAVANDLHYEAMTLPAWTWSAWEWPHSIPRGDPLNYQGNDGVMMAYVFNNLYTVADSDWFDAYRCNTGLAITRHYCLNEDCMSDSLNNKLVGYFVADMELAGPYSVLPEARAVAYGDPYYIGYLSANGFNRGFPGYAREFNANFLALPALPMTTETGAASDDEVIVRSISTASDGIWLAIVNTSLEDKESVEITLPVSGTVTDAVTGDAIQVSSGKITLDMWPGRLKSVHIAP